MHPVSISGYFDTLTQSQKIYTRQLEPVCRKWELTRSELDVLLFLNNNPEFDRASDVVTHRGMTKSHVSLSVTNLESRGLIRGRTDPEDRRTVRLALTPAAGEICARGRELQEVFFTKLFAGLSQEQLDLWLDIKQTLGRNIEAMGQE